jgi:hypothetical protein
MQALMGVRSCLGYVNGLAYWLAWFAGQAMAGVSDAARSEQDFTQHGIFIESMGRQ